MRGWNDISTAPRDGSLIRVGGENEWYEMRWKEFGSSDTWQPDADGFWEASDGSFTWSEADGFGPTCWLPRLYVVAGRDLEEVHNNHRGRRLRSA
jgi:hypothetical protein